MHHRHKIVRYNAPKAVPRASSVAVEILQWAQMIDSLGQPRVTGWPISIIPAGCLTVTDDARGRRCRLEGRQGGCGRR